VIERIGAAAYRLQLPDGAKIHSVFHCSLLKPFKGSPTQSEIASLPAQFINGQPVISPLAILNYHKVPGSTPDSWEVLVQWQGMSPDKTSWDDWTQLCQAYHLEDKVNFQGPGNDTSKLIIPEIEEAPATKVQRE